MNNADEQGGRDEPEIDNVIDRHIRQSREFSFPSPHHSTVHHSAPTAYFNHHFVTLYCPDYHFYFIL
jgi:hypothetical protein